MSGIASRWVVKQEHPFGGGPVGDKTIEGWVAAAREAYLDRCALLLRLTDEPGLVLRSRGMPCDGARLGHPAGVVVSASATEVRPGSFTLAVRLRPYGGEIEAPVNTSCVITVADEVTGEVRELGTAIRDELIGLEHGASYLN